MSTYDKALAMMHLYADIMGYIVEYDQEVKPGGKNVFGLRPPMDNRNYWHFFLRRNGADFHPEMEGNYWMRQLDPYWDCRTSSGGILCVARRMDGKTVAFFLDSITLDFIDIAWNGEWESLADVAKKFEGGEPLDVSSDLWWPAPCMKMFSAVFPIFDGAENWERKWQSAKDMGIFGDYCLQELHPGNCDLLGANHEGQQVMVLRPHRRHDLFIASWGFGVEEFIHHGIQSNLFAMFDTEAIQNLEDVFPIICTEDPISTEEFEEICLRGSRKEPIDIKKAEFDLKFYRPDVYMVPAGLTPEEHMEAFNRAVCKFQKKYYFGYEKALMHFSPDRYDLLREDPDPDSCGWPKYLFREKGTMRVYSIDGSAPEHIEKKFSEGLDCNAYQLSVDAVANLSTVDLICGEDVTPTVEDWIAQVVNLGEQYEPYLTEREAWQDLKAYRRDVYNMPRISVQDYFRLFNEAIRAKH